MGLGNVRGGIGGGTQGERIPKYPERPHVSFLRFIELSLTREARGLMLLFFSISQDNDQLLKDLDSVYAHDPTATNRPLKLSANTTNQNRKFGKVDAKKGVSAHSPLLPVKEASNAPLRGEATPVLIRRPLTAVVSHVHEAAEATVGARAQPENEAQALPAARVVAVVAPARGAHNAAPSDAARRASADAASGESHVGSLRGTPGGLAGILAKWFRSL